MCIITLFLSHCSMKVEIAHGGRGQSFPVGRGSRRDGGGNKYGVSHRSEYRGDFY